MNQEQKRSEQQMHKALQIMQILGINMDEAFQLLTMTHFTVDMAIYQYEHMNQHRKTINSSGQKDSHSMIQVSSRDFMRSNEKFKGNRNKQKEKDNYFKTYVKEKFAPKNIKQRKSTRKNPKSSAQNLTPQKQEFNFKIKLQQNLGFQLNINLQENIHKAFETLWQKRTLIALHCLSLQNLHQKKELQTFSRYFYSQAQIILSCNKCFINTGINPKRIDQKITPFLKDLIQEKDQSAIIFLRYDKLKQKVIIFKKIQLQSEQFKDKQPQFFKKMLQKISSQNHKISYNEEYQILPASKEQLKKIQMDRIIRKQQQQQYYQSYNKQVMNEVQEKEEKVEIVENITQLRRKARDQLQQLVIEKDNCINLKIRLPNGSSILLKLSKDQKIDYLFKVIQNNENEDLGFQDEKKRKFDLVQPLQRISLFLMQDKSLKQVFQTSQNEALIIKEF